MFINNPDQDMIW